jgi:UTP:GlnB (protein PII) uridylyltransferase
MKFDTCLQRISAFFSPIYSLLNIETTNRPGLLVEIIKIIADINIDVESADH